jgi:hypothetical protein
MKLKTLIGYSDDDKELKAERQRTIATVDKWRRENMRQFIAATKEK